MQLFVGGLVGILYMANVLQESIGFYATYLEILMMVIGALVAFAVNCWRTLWSPCRKPGSIVGGTYKTLLISPVAE